MQGKKICETAGDLHPATGNLQPSSEGYGRLWKGGGGGDLTVKSAKVAKVAAHGRFHWNPFIHKSIHPRIHPFFGSLRKATEGYGRLRKTPRGGRVTSIKPDRIANHRPRLSPPHATAPSRRVAGVRIPLKISRTNPLNQCNRSSLPTVGGLFPLSLGERAGVRASSMQPRHETLMRNL
jgi:hypothetical protein